MQNKLPWYKERWVWLLIGIPATSVVLSSIMIYVAINGRDTLVTDDYYKEGVAINQSLAKDRAALDMELQAAIRVEDDGRTFHIAMQGQPEALESRVSKQILLLNFEHPTRHERDALLRLAPSGEGYLGQLEEAPKGKYYLTLYDPAGEWRLQVPASFPDTEIRMQPKTNLPPL